MTAGEILILCLVLFDFIATSMLVFAVSKVRADQSVELGILKWLWEKELRRQNERKAGK